MKPYELTLIKGFYVLLFCQMFINLLLHIFLEFTHNFFH